MKKLIICASLASVFAAGNALADVTASATATWDATATKDTTSELVVTPLNSLVFQYANGVNAFNTQDGAFDLTIQGQEGATDFELTAQIITNTLSASGDDTSTLDVGVEWNGSALNSDRAVVIANSSKTSGMESLFVDGAYNGSERVSAQPSMKFSIASATTDGSTAVSDFSTLPDGYWSGDVKVQFNATWTTPENA